MQLYFSNLDKFNLIVFWVVTVKNNIGHTYEKHVRMIPFQETYIT